MKNEKIAYIQWLRVAAAFAVVLMHTAANKWNDVPIDSGEWLMLTAWDSLVRWPVPVFVMITGALFLPRKTDLRTALTRYIPRIFAAWLVWAGIYGLNSGRSGWDLMFEFVSGHYHLWYLPYLCGVYLVLPFLQKIAENARLTKQFLWVSCVIAVLIPWLADLTVLMWPGATNLVRAAENHLNYTFFFDLLAVLVLGHVLHQTDQSPKARRVIYIAGILSVAVTGAATVWASRHVGNPNQLFFDHAAPTTLCTAAALFVFAKYHLTRLPKAVEWMARHSFGVYLSHAFFIELLADRGIHVLAWDPVWGVPALAAGVFAISLAVTAVIAKIPFVGKYLT